MESDEYNALIPSRSTSRSAGQSSVSTVDEEAQKLCQLFKKTLRRKSGEQNGKIEDGHDQGSNWEVDESIMFNLEMLLQ